MNNNNDKSLNIDDIIATKNRRLFELGCQNTEAKKIEDVASYYDCIKSTAYWDNLAKEYHNKRLYVALTREQFDSIKKTLTELPHGIYQISIDKDYEIISFLYDSNKVVNETQINQDPIIKQLKTEYGDRFRY